MARPAGSLSIDASAVGDNGSIWVVSTVYDRLYQSTVDGKTAPSLATGHTLSKDKLTWTFPLRSGVKFSDGTPLTAADVKFSIDRCTKSDANGYMNVAIDSVRAPDKNTVVIKTKYQTELLGVISYFANGVIPNNYGGKSKKEFFKNPVSTGPFIIQSWVQGKKLVLARNSHYRMPGKPYLDQVVLSSVPDDNSRILQLKGGQVDAIASPPWSQLTGLSSQPNIRVGKYKSTLVYFLSLNQKTEPLGDADIRNAMSYAIDRQAIVKVALFGNGDPAGSLFSPSWPDYDSSLVAPKQDLQKAKSLLAKSSRPHGFSVTLSIVGGDTVQTTAAQQIQNDLAKIGIKVSIKSFDPNTLEDMVGKKQFSIYFDSLSLDVMDPFENVPYAVDPSVGGDGADANYNDPKVIEWSRKASRTSSATLQKKYYTQIQQRISATSPFISLYYVPFVYAMSQKVQGFTVPPTGDWRLEDVWIKK